MKVWMGLLGLVAGCGGAEIVASSPLLILATYPGDGALVEPGEDRLAFSFSEPIDEATLGGAVNAEELTQAGSPVRELSVSSVFYTQDTMTAVFQLPPMADGVIYQVRLSAAQVVAESGARLVADYTVRFQAR